MKDESWKLEVGSWKGIWGRYVDLLKGRDKGTVAITFLLALPILMTILGVIVQYALMVNGKLTVERAAQAAARSAMTALPTDPALGDAGGPAYVERAALMVLESLSPASPDASTDGQAVAAALAQVGANPPASYAARYTYAQGATVVTIERLNYTTSSYARSEAPRVRITVQYDMLLTAPLVKYALGRSDTVAGVTGRFQTITASMEVQLSHGREANSNVAGGGLGWEIPQ